MTLVNRPNLNVGKQETTLFVIDRPTLAPTTSLAPSVATATTSLPADDCDDVFIAIFTGNITGDVVTWELYDQAGNIVVQGGPLDSFDSLGEDIGCLEQGDYLFNITNNNGNGLGECDDDDDECLAAYMILANDDVTLGG